MLYYSIIVTIVCVVFMFTTYNLLRKNEQLEDLLENIYIDLKKIIAIIESIDAKGSFESDDEVGDTYKLIRSTIMYIERYIQNEGEV